MRFERYGRFVPCVLGMSLVSVAGCASKAAPNGASAMTQGDGSISPAPSAGLDGSVLADAPDTSLPPLPALTNVSVTEREDSVGIDFDPVEGAIDYRVYPLPADSDIAVNSDQSLTIANAIYRCAGVRETFDLPNGVSNPVGVVPDGGQTYENFNEQYSWSAQIPANPTLGYVYVVAGTGLVPVYAVAVHPTAPELGWNESRPKIYTTDANLYQSLLADGGGRDDGIVFYVPSTASSSTTTIYHSETAEPGGSGDPLNYTEYYFTSAAMAMHTGDTTPPSPAFQVLTASADGTQPLMSVFYMPGQNHDELVAGKERFNRAANQGPGPLWHVEWSGITQPTTLVLEALSSGCPFQGSLSPQTIDAPPHQPILTLEQIQQASPTGEAYVNGQYDLPGTTFPILIGNGSTGGVWGISDAGSPTMQTPNSSPIPIARTFIQVSPHPHDPTAWDWYQGFTVGGTLPALTPMANMEECACVPTGPTPCISGSGACGYFNSSLFNVESWLMDYGNSNDKSAGATQGNPVFAYGQFGGQLWDVFDDVWQDVGAMIRMSVPQTTTVSDSSFLHVTWSVNVMSTHRRYPQLLVTDTAPPTQDALDTTTNNSIILQTFSGTSPEPAFEEEAFHGLVNGNRWAVNNQAPGHWFINTDTWNATDPQATLQPYASIFERAGVDRMTQFDAYISTSTVYTFVDGLPAGCVMQPTTGGFNLSGKVWVAFGDVLYHEAATDEGLCDESHPYMFEHEHQCEETKRHWDDLGFKAGVAAPAWDNDRFPCVAY